MELPLNKNLCDSSNGLCPIYNHDKNSNTHYEFGEMDSLRVDDRDIR